MSLITLATSSLATISTVVCIYLNGREISAEGTPPLENAKECGSGPVIAYAPSVIVRKI